MGESVHSLEPGYLDLLAFSHEQLATVRTLGEYRGKQRLYFQQTPEVLAALQQVAIIESTESSNRLEGITASRRRVEALVRKSTHPVNRSEQEIAGYRDALALIHESAREMPFSTNVILHLHSILYRYLPQEGGRWKNVDNQIVEKNSDGSIRRIRFRPVSALATPEAMAKLVENYRRAIDQQSREPLVIIPFTILDFLCIHPFTDGNGRVARLLTLMLLYHFGYEVGRYLSLERIFEESKETYYETLEASSRGWHEGQHDIFPWTDYFWGVLLRAYGEFEERVGTIRKGKGAKTDQIRTSVQRRIGPFSISDIEADCPGISRDMIRLVLRQLRDEGLIVARGKGRSAKWIRRDQG